MKYQTCKGESAYSKEGRRARLTPAAEGHGLWPWMSARAFGRDVAPHGGDEKCYGLSLWGSTVRIALPILLSAFSLQAILCLSAAVSAPVQQPQLLQQIKWTGTSWFASPIIHNLGRGDPKLIGTFYDIFVWDKNFNELARARSGSSYPHEGRIYAPAVCADLDGDGIYEIVVGSGNGKVAAYEWRNNTLSVKAGWPASACDAGQCPEVRGLAAGDLNRDGKIEIVATTTQTAGGAQVFVFNPDGTLHQPPGLSYTAWPRYNTETGPGNDADANGPGNHGYGCYGLNVGIGNLNDDPFREIVVTFDNHQINAFYHDGVSMLASPYFTNRSSEYYGNRLNWGQFIRWFDPAVEENHYHLHTGDWPHPSVQKWMQWTESPPGVADLNGDGKNEVVCVSNVEMDEPYDTKHHSVMVLEGSYGDGARSARRLPGWESLSSTDYPLSRAGRTWYPPTNPPGPTVVNITGDSRPEIIFGGHDGYVYCISPNAERLWRADITHGRALMYASEVVVADLNQDHAAELILTTFGDPDSIAPGVSHGYLMILDRNGNILYDLELPEQGTNGNGKGAPAAPTVMDLNGDGALEIVVQTFGAGCFIYTVPGSAENQLLWPTGRGNYLRDGRAVSLTQLHPVDFDGNGATDVAGFHLPSDQLFTDASGNMGQYGWDGADCYPVVWDYDGDGATDVSIYHIPTNQWFVQGYPGDNLGQFGWGGDESIPVPGDYNGDGLMERAFYHWPSNRWFVEGQEPVQFGWGGADCIPIAADYHGDGATDRMLYHVPTNQWFVYGVGNLGQFGWHGSECLPVPGDWDGDGKVEIGIYHQPSNQWSWKNQDGTVHFLGQYGWEGMESFPIPGDYNGDGVIERGFYRYAENGWFIEGEADFVWGWGGPDFMPITSQTAVYSWFRFMLGMFQ